MERQQLIKDGKHSPGAFLRPKNGNGHKEPTGFPNWQYETITKARAAELLAKMNQVRHLDLKWVAGLVRTMDAGLWDKMAGRTPIAIDWDGNTLNGQHRLTAFRESRLEEIAFLFVLNCDPDDYRSFDADTKARTGKQLHPEMAFAQRESARVSFCEVLTSANLQIRQTHSTLGHLYEKTWHKAADWAAELVPKYSGEGRACFMGVLMYVFRADREFAERLGQAWASVGGDGLPQELKRFREAAVRNHGGKGARTMTENIRNALRFLNGASLMHQRKPITGGLKTNIAGLRYFSELARDGAAKKWEANPLADG